VGESSLPSVIVNCDDRDNTFKTTNGGVFGLKNGFGRDEFDQYQVGTKCEFGITGVGNRGPVVCQPSSTRPSDRVRMCSDGGLTIDSSSSLSSSDDDDSDNDDELPTSFPRCFPISSSSAIVSDDDSGFGFAAVRGALDQAASSSAVPSGVKASGGVVAARGRDVAVPVRFTVPLTASLEIVWDAILCRGALVVPRLPPNGAAGSKESLIQLLEFAEDQLGCESVFICLPKADAGTGNASSASSFSPSGGGGGGGCGGGPNASSTLVRMFSFLGFDIVDRKDEGAVAALPSIFRSTPQLLEGTVVQYDIEESDF